MLNLKSAGFSWASVFLFGLCAMRVNAQTYIYNTTTDGNWTSNATWQNGASGRAPVSGNCDCIIYVNPGDNLIINQNITLSNVQIVLLGNGSKLTFASEIVFAQTMQLTGNSSIELRDPGSSIQSTSNFLGYNGNTISVAGTVVFQGYLTKFNSTTRGVVSGPATVNSSMVPPVFVNILLPVKLIEFAASEYRGTVLVRWKCSDDERLDSFEVQKSIDGKKWENIGGMGDDHDVSAFSFSDLLPMHGANYYRLKMVDADSRFTYSDIAMVRLDLHQSQLKVYPNPATTFLNIGNAVPGAPYDVRLMRSSGKIVLHQRLMSPTAAISVNVGTLERGVYFLLIADADGVERRAAGIVLN